MAASSVDLRSRWKDTGNAVHGILRLALGFVDCEFGCRAPPLPSVRTATACYTWLPKATTIGSS